MVTVFEELRSMLLPLKTEEPWNVMEATSSTLSASPLWALFLSKVVPWISTTQGGAILEPTAIAPP
jgi:hypothetical protein